MKAVPAACLAALLLAACGDNAADTVLNVLNTSADVLTAGDTADRGTAPGLAADGFTPEQVAASPDDYRLFTINALGIAELARRLTSADGRETFVSQSGFTAAYKDGVLVATRGLIGEDIMAASAPGLLDTLAAGGGTINRAIETLDSLNQIQTATFTCTIAPAGTETVNLGIRSVSAARFDENCRGTALIFDNIYWLDDQGVILASRQYVSPTVAYLRSNRL
jgi:uncharacterized protein YcfL